MKSPCGSRSATHALRFLSFVVFSSVLRRRTRHKLLIGNGNDGKDGMQMKRAVLHETLENIERSVCGDIRKETEKRVVAESRHCA